jgi:Tfp pilus assembly protein FimT
MKELANAGEAALVIVTVIALVVVIGLPIVSEWRRRHGRRY